MCVCVCVRVCVSSCNCLTICKYMYVDKVHTIRFQTFFFRNGNFIDSTHMKL